MTQTKTFNLSIVKKITLAGIILALTVIFNKVIAINYIPGIPFARVSFGGIGLIIFSSIVLGPIYGAVVGAGADILGYFIFDMSSFGWFPQITLTYLILGILPYFIYRLTSLIKSNKVMEIIEYSVFFLVEVFLIIYFILAKDVSVYGSTFTFPLYVKIIVPCATLLLFSIIIFFNQLIKKRFDLGIEGFNVSQISFIVFVSEILVNLLFGSLMKAWAFGFDMFFTIILCQAIVMFFNIPYNTYLIFVIMKISKNSLLE